MYVRTSLFAVLLLAAWPARADVIFTNLGQPGATSYQGDQYGLVEQGFDFQTVTLSFTPTRNVSNPISLFLPVFFFSTGADPLGRDSINSNGIFLSLANPSGELWNSGLLFPTILFHGDGGNDPLLNRALFH